MVLARSLEVTKSISKIGEVSRDLLVMRMVWLRIVVALTFFQMFKI